MRITREWLEAVSDENGLTPGQQKVLAIWTTPPIVGATIPDQVAEFVGGCKGYRGMPDRVKDMLNAPTYD